MSRFVAVFVFIALTAAPGLYAYPQTSAADETLLNAANRDRAAAGLQPLKWNNALAGAAHQHALRMAHANTLSHQLPHEPSLQERARHAGARFSVIAENVAQGPSVSGLHTQWMNSPPHRANLLDPQLNAIGISVVQSGSTYFAVEDFSTAVASLSLEEQEQQVASQLSELGLRNVSATEEARKTCASDRSGAGQRPVTIVRYETADLSHLPEEVAQKARSGKYQSAAVGACEANGSSTFAHYRIAILLF
jgi:Cysteine-rich secretory protein family